MTDTLDDKNTNSANEVSESKESFEIKYNPVQGLEFKEIDGALHLKGYIATTHIDQVGDYIPKSTLESWAKELNSGNPAANKLSFHHNIIQTVLGKAIPGSAEVKSMPKGNHGLYVETKMNVTSAEYKEAKYEIENGFADGFSVEYTTHDGATTVKEFKEGRQVRTLLPQTELKGYGLASRGINPHAQIDCISYKELRGINMNEQEKSTPAVESKETVQAATPAVEAKEFVEQKSVDEFKEQINNSLKQISERVDKMEVKEKVMNTGSGQEISLEFKEFKEILEGKELSMQEQFRRASAFAEHQKLIGTFGFKETTGASVREYKSFGTNGSNLEYKSLGITTNQNTDTDYLQSAAELQDAYDPVIYNLLNQKTTLWGLLAKDNYAGKGNNQVQFTAKTAANASAGFYTGNAVTSGNVFRLKFQTKFKKIQVGVSVDGDMIAAARGGPVSDVFAQEVMDSTIDMLSVLNAALFAETGLETAPEIIGLEYISDSAGNTTLYNLTRSTTNRLAPASAGDTYINGASAQITMANLRSAIRQPILEGADRKNLVLVTHPIQADILRSKFDDIQRRMSPKDTGLGFETDLFVDGVPVFEDKDCTSDNWHCVDLETHRVAIWQPPTIEILGKTGDSMNGFIKMYLATYNRRPRGLTMIYDNATS